MVDYTYLVNDIINTAENTGTEFVDQIPRFVNKAENRLVKELDDIGLNTTVSITCAVSNQTVSIADDTRIIRHVNLRASGSKINLLQRTEEFIHDYWPFADTSTGVPKYYAVANNSSIYLAPTPTSAYQGEVVYVARPTTLTSATPNNYFSDFCYNALFYASMIEAFLYMKDTTFTAVFTNEYKGAIEGLRNQARRNRQDNMQNNASPAGSANTLVQGSQ